MEESLKITYKKYQSHGKLHTKKAQLNTALFWWMVLKGEDCQLQQNFVELYSLGWKNVI